jgi:hypothetical protein
MSCYVIANTHVAAQVHKLTYFGTGYEMVTDYNIGTSAIFLTQNPTS